MTAIGPEPTPGRRFARQVALSYLALGFLCVLGGDALLFLNDRQSAFSLAIQLAKGGLWVALSSTVVYYLLCWLSPADGARQPRARATRRGGGRGMRLAATVALANLALGLAWVFGSDLALHYLGWQDRTLMATQWLKGSAFMVASAFVVFLLVQLGPGARISGHGDDPAQGHREFWDQWRMLPQVAALAFVCLAVVLTLTLDVYQFAVTGEQSPQSFRTHVAEGVLLSFFLGAVLYVVLRFFVNALVGSWTREFDSTQRYASLFAHHPDAVYLLDREGRFLDVNPALAGLARVEPGQLIGQSWEALAHPDDVEPVRRQFQATLRGEPQSYEARAIKGDGEPAWVQVTNIPRFEGGRVTGVFGIARDITPQKTAGDRISASEARYRALFDHSLDAVFLTTPGGAIEAANPAAQAMLELTEAEIIERGRSGLVDTSDPALAELLAERDRKGHARGILRWKRADGSIFPVEITSARFRDSEGRDKAFVVAHDISERERHEAQIRASEARHRSIFENSMDGLLLLTSEGRILAANPAAEVIFGMSESELKARGRTGITDQSDPAVHESIAERRRTGRSSAVIRMVRGDGQTFLAEINSVQFQSAVGEELVSVVVRDVTKQHEREQLLERSEARYRELYHSHPDAVFEFDPDGVIRHVNEATCRMTGFDETDLVGSNFSPLVAPEDLETGWAHFQAVVAGETRSFKVRAVRHNGDTYWTQVIGVPRTERGKLIGAVAIVRDIDVEHRAQEELAESEARYRILYEQSPDAILLVDAETGVNLDVNSAAEALFGMDRSKLIGRIRMTEKDVDDANFRAFLDDRQRHGRARGVLRMRRSDGSQFPADVISTEFQDRRGQTLAITTVRDISEQFQREAEIRESEERYRALFEQSAEAIFLTEPGGSIFAANRTAQELFGYTEEELCELGRGGLVDPGEPAFQQMLAERRKSNRARAEIHMRRKDGTWFLADISVLGFKDHAGRDRTSVVLRDVTEARRREAALRESEERFRTLYERSIDAILISDATDRRVVGANPAAQSLFGLSEEELCRRPLEQAIDVEDPAAHEYFQAREQQGHARGRLRMRRGDGTWFTAEVTSGVFRDAEGRLMANTIIRDITEQEEYERQLQRSDERFRIVTDNTGQAIYEIDLETGESVWSGACESMFGYHPRMLDTMGAGERLRHVPESERDRVAETYAEAIRAGGTYRVEYPLITADGRDIYVEDQGVVLPDRGRVYGAIQDVTEQHHLTRDLEAREQRLTELSQLQEAILDALPAHIGLLDDAGTLEYVNAAWRRFARENDFLGAHAGVGQNYLAVCDRAKGRDAADARAAAKGIREVISGAKTQFSLEYPCHGPEERRWFTVAFTPFRAGERRGAVVAHTNISDRKEAERQLELVAAAFRSADEALLICNSDFEILDVNHAYERLTGRSRDDAIGSRPLFLEIEQQERNIRRGLQAEGQWRGELIQRNLEGRAFVSRAAVNEVYEPGTRAPHLVVSFQDISQLREYERQVDYLSYHDALTGLPNRLALSQWFQAFEAPGAAGGTPPIALVYFNLDRLKTVNEAYGHSLGDDLIREIGARLRGTCEGDDYTARLGGDEFVLVIDDVSDEAVALEATERRLALLMAPMRRGEFVLRPTLCAGVALAPAHGSTLEDLLRKADVAMNRAKRQGRGEIMLFTSELSDEVEEQTQIEQHLRDGISNEEFLMHYQPSVRLNNGRIIGLEALVRWENSQLGLVPPSRFIPVAEDSGLIIELGDWIFEEVCRQAAEWNSRNVRYGWVAVNLSPIQFQDPELLQKIQATLERHGVEGRQIRVEITENVLVLDPEWTIGVLSRLRAMGIQIAVDDFGTGYSSLAYLKQFPVDFVKLDKTFIDGLPDDVTDTHIVSSVIDLARRLGMGVVAEGIEHERQMAFLKEAGCQEAQGYYFSLPLSTEDLPWLLERHRTLPVKRAPRKGEKEAGGA